MQLSADQYQTLNVMFANAQADTSTSDYPYAAIYTWLANQLSSSTDPAVQQVVMWLNGAAQANGNTDSMFSVLIRDYTARQGLLRGVSTDGLMQQASNTVAYNAIRNILNNSGTVPTIQQIADADATGVGSTLFSSMTQDSAYADNSAWSGALLFSILGNNQTYRLFDEVTPGTWTAPNLDTLKNVAFAYDSLTYALGQAAISETALAAELIGMLQAGDTESTVLSSLASTVGKDLGISVAETGTILSLLYQGANFLLKEGVELSSLSNALAGCLFAGVMQNCGQPALLTYIIQEGLPAVMNDINETLGRVSGTITSDNYLSVAASLFDGTATDAGYTLTFLPEYTAEQIAEMAVNNPGIQAALLALSPLGITGTTSSGTSTSNSFEYWLERAELDLAKYAQATISSLLSLQAFYSTHGLTASSYTDDATGATYSDSLLPASMTNQVIFGTGKGDTLQGGSGKDTLFGGQGHDTLIAGSGNETLVSGGGGNTLEGGTGTNTYYVQNGDTVVLGSTSNIFYIGPDAYALSTSYWDSSQQGFRTLDGSTLLTPEGTNELLVTHQNSDGSVTTFTIKGVTIASNGDGYAPSVSGLSSIETFTMQDIAAGSNLQVYSSAHAIVGPDGSVSGPDSSEIQVSTGSYLRLEGVNPADIIISVSTHQYEPPASGYSWEYGSSVSLTSTWITITDIVTGTILTFEDVGDPNNQTLVGGIIFGDGTQWTMADLEKYANGGSGLPSTYPQIEVVGDSTLNYATSGNTANLPLVSYTVKAENDIVDVTLLTDKDLTVQGFKSTANTANRLVFSNLSSTSAVFKQLGSDLLVIDPTDGSSITVENYFDSTINTANRQVIQFSNGITYSYDQIESTISQINSPASSVSDLWQHVSVSREASGRLSFSVEPVVTAIAGAYSSNSSLAVNLLSAFLTQINQLSTIADFPDYAQLREELIVMGGTLASEVVSMGTTQYLAADSTGAYTYTSGSTVNYLAGTNGGTYVDSQTSVTNDFLDGNSGNDILTGGLGSNVLDGHGGADVLTGGQGAGNTYILGSSFGLQTIVNERAAGDTRTDTIQFINGIVESMVTLARAGNDLLVTLTGTSNQMLVKDYFVTATSSTETGQVASIVFADGTTLTAAQVAAMNLPTVADPSQTISAPSNDTGSTLQAWGQGSTLIAGSGNDTLLGAGGNDTLIAGTGNDMMKGGNGTNSYVFGSGFGTDVIDNTSASSAEDTIVLNAASASAVTVTQSGVDLIITIAGQNGSITYKGFFNTAGTSPLQSIEFADGTSWDAAQIKQEALSKTVYDLGGSTGSSYAYAFLNSATLDVIQVASGLTESDLSFIPTANNTLQIVVKSTGQTVEVTNWFSDGTDPAVVVKFADGSQLTWAQINALLPQSGVPGDVIIHSDGSSALVAGSGNDVLFSSTGTEEIIGGPGQDTINVMGGSHTIEIGTGATTVNLEGYPMGGQTVVYSDTSGNLAYNNQNGEGTAPNVLQLASDITPDDVTVSLVADAPLYPGGPVASADIVLTLSTGQTITLQDALTQYAETTPALDTIQFGDGTTWSWTQLLAQVESHAGSDGFAHLASGQTFGVSDGSAPLIAGSANATLISFSENDYLFGGTGNDNLIANAGYDILQAGSGNSTLTSNNQVYDPTTFSVKSLPSLLDGGSGVSTINLNGGIALADKGSSTMYLGGPTDVVLYNKGDGTDYVSSSASKLVLSLGNGISASDITLSQSGYDLDLNIGGSEIVLQNYLAPWTSHASDVLQLFTNTGTASDATQLQSQDFNLADIVSAFEAAEAANPSLTSWSLSSALSQLSSTTETGEAYGGDVAAYYAMNGTLQNMSLSSAQGTLTDASFGSLQQLHQNLSGGSKTLLG